MTEDEVLDEFEVAIMTSDGAAGKPMVGAESITRLDAMMQVLGYPWGDRGRAAIGLMNGMTRCTREVAMEILRRLRTDDEQIDSMIILLVEEETRYVTDGHLCALVDALGIDVERELGDWLCGQMSDRDFIVNGTPKQRAALLGRFYAMAARLRCDFSGRLRQAAVITDAAMKPTSKADNREPSLVLMQQLVALITGQAPFWEVIEKLKADGRASIRPVELPRLESLAATLKEHGEPGDSAPTSAQGTS